MDLVRLARVLFDESANRWLKARALETLAALVGFAGVVSRLDEHSVIALIVGGLAVALLAVAQVMHLTFEARYELAERARRYGFLANALGWVVPAKLRTDIRAEAGAKALAIADRDPLGAGYYVSSQGTGVERLADNLQESAFWTAQQYRRTRSYLLWITLCLLTLVIVTIFAFLVSPAPQDVRITVGRLLMAVVPFLLTTGAAGWLMKLGRLIQDIERIDNDVEAMRFAGKLTERDILRLVDDYNCQVAQGFPIPHRFYERWRAELNDLWRERSSRLAGR